MSATVLDAHVHFYPQYEEAEFLRSAVANLGTLLDQFAEARSQRSGAIQEDRLSGVLCLTESRGCNWFSELSGSVADWTVRECGEPCAKLLEAPTGERLIVIAGRQVVTRERLEVLVLGQTEEVPDGSPAVEVVDGALAEQRVVILPWGFGKWWFKRGKTVAALMQAYGARIYLGDNSGRAALLPRPRLLRLGEELGMKLLSGSDPLPLSGEARNVGRLGNALDDLIELEAPFAWLRTQLVQQLPYECGRRESLWRFVKNQLQMQIKKQR